MDLSSTSDKLSECKGEKNDSDVVENSANGSSDSDTPIIKRFCFRTVFTLDPIPEGNDSTLVWDNSVPAAINELLLKDRELPKSLAAYLTLKSLKTTAGYLISFSLIEDGPSEEINIFEEVFLSALPGPTSFQFTLAIEHLPDQVQFTGNNLRVTKLQEDSYELEMWLDIPEKLGIKWREIGKMSSGLIIGLTLHLDDAAVGAVYFGKMALLKLFRDKLKFGRRLFLRWSEMLLNGDTGTDMVVKGGDKLDTAIKLHKSIFSEKSPLLKALLKLKKCIRGRYFGEMTEVGVQALIRFIYSWDLGEAWKSCDIALELLKAGILFEMEDLTDAMEKLICFMPFNWFSWKMVSDTENLICFIRALSNGERLREVRNKCSSFWDWFNTDNYKGISWTLGRHASFWDETSSKVEYSLVKKEMLAFGRGLEESSLKNEFISSFRLILCPGYSIKERSNIFWANFLLAQVDLNGKLFTNLKVCLKTGEQRNAGSLNVLIDDDDGYESTVNIFEELANFPPSCYGFNLEIFGYWYSSPPIFKGLKINEKNLKVEKFEDGTFGLQLTGIDVGEKVNHDRESGFETFFAGFSLTLVIDEEIGNVVNWMEPVKNRFNKWSRMLQNGLTIPTDLVIKAAEKNGEGIKCHKFVLSERSLVFKVMLEVDMKECRDGCVEIGDMTEAGVKAMLGFIYRRDLEGAWKDCGVALELLEAGLKYDMEDLAEVMVEVVGAMPFEWFRKDVVEEMVGFAGVVGGKLEKVGEKCLAVLKWLTDNQTDTLMESKGASIKKY